MSSLAKKAHPLLNSLPPFLTWRALGFRTICSGRLGFAPSDPDPPTHPVAGTKVLETFREEFEIGSRLITLETGKIARFANGAVVLGMDETKVLSTVTSAKGDAVRDFLPLTVCAIYSELSYLILFLLFLWKYLLSWEMIRKLEFRLYSNTLRSMFF